MKGVQESRLGAEEKEALSILGDKVRKGSRMSCQIYLENKHSGMEVEIPEAAFFFQDNE